jgi:hypothetical protein
LTLKIQLVLETFKVLRGERCQASVHMDLT